MAASWPSMRLQKALWRERLRPGASCGNNGHRFSFPSPGGRAEDMVVCSSPGGATDCTRLGLAWVVSARPRSPRSMGAERDSRSASWLWTCSKAGEAGLKGKKKKKPKASRQLRPSACKSEPASLRGEGTLFVVRSRSDRQRAPRGLYASPTVCYGRGATCLESLVS